MFYKNERGHSSVEKWVLPLGFDIKQMDKLTSTSLTTPSWPLQHLSLTLFLEKETQNALVRIATSLLQVTF